MTTAASAGRTVNETDDWLRAAFRAERAPARCRLPAPTVLEEPAGSRPPRAPAVRGSFLVMLAFATVALLIGL